MEEEIKPDGIELEDVLRNGAMLVLAEAVDDPQLSLEETGAAEELLALASEASFSSPINQADEKENNNPASHIRTTSSSNRKHICNNCGTTSTPFWRKSSEGVYYCNACGLYLRTHNTMRPLALSKNRDTRRTKMRPEACGNCGATETPMWRKTEDGLVVCNACGLYHKLHNQHRQVGLKRIKPVENSLPAAAKSSVGKKTGRTADFTLVHENRILKDNFGGAAALTSSNSRNSTKYSLEPQFHHKFLPTRLDDSNTSNNCSRSNKDSNSTNTQVVAPIPMAPAVISSVESHQAVDPRKLAYLKNPQGRSVPPLAPKLPLIDSMKQQPQHPHQSQQQQQSTNSPLMPPILANFINSLASTSPDNLTSSQVDHPLQPLLTSIVSQKLKEQKRRGNSVTIGNSINSGLPFNPHSQSNSVTPNNSSTSPPLNVQAMQQQGYTVDYWSPAHLAEFMQNQQQAVYNQQMIQQALFNHQQQLQQQLPNSNNSSYNYNDYIDYNASTSEQQQQQQQQQQMHIYHQLQQQQIQYLQQQNYQYQNPHFNNSNTNNNSSLGHINQQDTNYFLEQFTQFPDHSLPQLQQPPPPRQLSPFSGLKFDKNLIELVNMQFWQEQDAASLSNGPSHQDQPEQEEGGGGGGITAVRNDISNTNSNSNNTRSTNTPF